MAAIGKRWLEVKGKSMTKRSGNREARKPKQPKDKKVQAAKSVSELETKPGLAPRRP
jgi:hypothetical protein